MQEYHQHAYTCDDAQREVNQGRQHNHRDTDHRNDLHRAKKAVIEIQERPAANESKFQNNQPESTSKQKLREFAFAFPAREMEVRPGAGKENEIGAQ